MKSSNAPNILTRRGFLGRSALVGATAATAGTIRDLRMINTAMAAENPTDYKALVCVFMGGGNDSNNMIVPTDAATHAQYTSIRGNLAIPTSSLLPLQDPGGGDYTDADGHTVGVHPQCDGLATLFQEGNAAAVMNVGSLVRPITRQEYVTNAPGTRPPQLFSHSNQVSQWQTSIPDAPPATGWGGRTADILNSVIDPPGGMSMSVSLAGANTFEIGNLVAQYQVSTNGAVALSGNLMQGEGARVRALRELLGLPHSNLQRRAYADVIENAIATGELLNANIQDTDESVTPFWTTPFPTTGIGNQLKMVARLIEARNDFNMKRQIFFVRTGGFDTHNGQNDGNPATGTHANLLAGINDSMFAFQRGMEQLGISNEVTAFTASDFTRTFPTNGQGSDHGWGGHHFVVGGAVNGGQTYGSFPEFVISGSDDSGNKGRWIPKFAVDQHGATLAKWFGLSSTDLDAVFPNLDRFSTPDLGFMA